MLLVDLLVCIHTQTYSSILYRYVYIYIHIDTFLALLVLPEDLLVMKQNETVFVATLVGGRTHQKQGSSGCNSLDREIGASFEEKLAAKI